MFYVIAGLIAVLTANTSTGGTVFHSPCVAIAQQRHVNVPPSGSSSAEILHGAAVEANGVFVGALYVTRASKVYLQRPPLGAYEKPAQAALAASQALASRLGIAHLEPGSIGEVDPRRLASIVGDTYGLTNCF